MKFFKNHPNTFSLITLLLIIAASFGQTINFELWQDDNALIFKLQHLDEQVGVFGPGAAGLGAYRYIALPYIPIYEMFGVKTPIFYLYAITFYFLAAISVFLLAKQLTQNYSVAFLSGSVFAAGFIGSDGVLRLFNSVQTSYSITFVCLFFIFLLRFTQKMDKWNYLIALSLFFISLETAFIRTQYLILPTMVFLILFLSWKNSGNRVRNLFLVAPFLLIYNHVFSYSTDSRVGLVKNYINGVVGGKFDYLHSFFGSLGNIMLPQPIQIVLFDWVKVFSLDYTNRLLILELIFLVGGIYLINLIVKTRKILVRILISILPVAWFVFGFAYFQSSEYIFSHSLDFDTLGIFANFLGGLFLILTGAIIFRLIVNRDKSVRIIIFLSVWMMSNVLAYSTYLPFSPLESINRYLTHSLAAYAILIPFVLYKTNKKIALVLPISITILNVFLSIKYQGDFIKEKSIPTRNFYNQLESYLPEIDKGDVIYFDVAVNKKSEQEFRDFFSVGSMPDTTAIAIRYGIDRYDFQMTSNFDEFLSFTKDKPASDAYSFFYGTDGLIDTTDLTRFRFSTGQKSNVLSDLVTPAVFEFSARVRPEVNVKESCTDSTKFNETLLRSYLLARDQYYKNVKVKTASQERYLQSKFLVDDESDTLWRGNRGWWHNNRNEEIVVDLGGVKNIGQLIWVNGYANSTPTEYAVYISLDGNSWDSVLEITGGGKKENGLLVKENFPAKFARYVRLTVTETFDGDSPAIAEIEIINDSFKNVIKDNIKALENLAFCAVNQDDTRKLMNFILTKGIIGTVSWETDKNPSSSVNFTLIPDGRFHKYKVPLPAGGTRTSDLKIESLQISAEIVISNSVFHYQPLQN